ncbi:hypothetical protein CEXT_37201 [Caerostris extrusa]|uniref:Uncharacterized protein n=1 Tax=Caerostris extrusa TaxID=172846 RepID=A0AAV4NS53_CAEEX|nr:hypothetical protein CEXT_37201 [Caerostris extrusa]
MNSSMRTFIPPAGLATPTRIRKTYLRANSATVTVYGNQLSRFLCDNFGVEICTHLWIHHIRIFQWCGLSFYVPSKQHLQFGGAHGLRNFLHGSVGEETYHRRKSPHYPQL